MRIVYQAYGRQDVLDQVYFSLVSYLSHRQPDSKSSVLVYTDRPDFFAPFQATDLVELRSITNEEIIAWAGPANFVHRVKLCILQDAATRVRDTMLYCDGDTVFLKDPEALQAQISPTTSVMHMCEYSFAKPNNPLAKKLRRFLKSHPSFGIDQSYSMWNAGVLGLAPQNFALLSDMIALSDELYQAYPKHVMEQLAVSVVLQRATQLTAAPEILHYWQQKPEFLNLIRNFQAANRDLSQAILAYKSITFPTPPEPKRSFFERLLSR